MGQFHAYEWVAVSYFLYLIVTAIAIPALPRAHRARVISVAFFMIIFAASLATIGAFWMQVLRLWVPLAYLVVGYWLPAQLVVGPNARFERILVAIDNVWFGPRGLATFREHAPRAVVGALELAYLACYPLVPLGFATLAMAGYTPAISDRFWTAVLGAALPCYGLLPWLPTRPPRAIERVVVDSGSPIRDMNVRVLRDVSVGWNTFPSGHAAASIATALAVGSYFPIAGIMFAIVATGICVGSVVGRYHYAADAVAGIVLAVAAFAFATTL